MSYYQKKIAAMLEKMGRTDVSPRFVEGWMRAEHATLDALTPSQWVTEMTFAVECIDGPDGHLSETLARSYGL